MGTAIQDVGSDFAVLAKRTSSSQAVPSLKPFIASVRLEGRTPYSLKSSRVANLIAIEVFQTRDGQPLLIHIEEETA